MNPTTRATEGSAAAPVLYMALELSNRSWRLAFGDGAKRRQASVPAADLAALAGAVAKAKEILTLVAASLGVSVIPLPAGRHGSVHAVRIVPIRSGANRTIAFVSPRAKAEDRRIQVMGEVLRDASRSAIGAAAA